MFLSAVWTLILTAPIHCRGSIAEQVMKCKISPNLFKAALKMLYEFVYVVIWHLDEYLVTFEMFCHRCYQVINHLKM